MAKKILLINPSFNIAKANYDSSVSVGLLSIATYLNYKGIEVEILDSARQQDFDNLLSRKVVGHQLAGLSVMTTQIPSALRISKLIKEANPECKIIWGGTHPTFFPKETISHSLVDIVNYGEGEETLYELASGRKVEDTSGLYYKKEGKIFSNPPRRLHEISDTPLLNWDLVPKEILENLSLIPSLTSRGCPHRCTFCINAILKNRWRARPVKQVLKDLEIIKSKDEFKNKPLRFWDENFFVDIGRARAIVEGMIGKGLIIPWETTVRANYIKDGMIDSGLLGKLRESGCYLLSFGAESGSPRILKKIQKDISPGEIIHSAKQCLKYNIIPQYSFMIGLPGETKEDMMMTLELIDRLIELDERVQILGPQAFRPYPGSPLYQECKDSGWREPSSLKEWSHLIENELNYLTVHNFPWVEDKDFVESMEAYVRFGAHSIKSAMGSTVQAQKFLKLGFVLACQLRWKLKFFKWPVEYKIAKRFVSG